MLYKYRANINQLRQVTCVCVCVCIMKHYLALRKREVLPFAITCMDIDNITSCRISQPEKVKNHMISLMWEIKRKATNEQTRKRNEQKLTDTNNSLAVKRQVGCGRTVNGEGGQIYGDGRRFGFRWWAHNAIYR